MVNSNRHIAVFYTCATCNLNCRYCNINKHSILSKVDKELEESFKGDYYFNRVKQYFPRKDMLTDFETWGGEPFLHMDRFHYTLKKLIEYYPYFNTGFSSTNFSYDTWIDQFFGLMDCFGEYPERMFNYYLQLSVDGPEYLNDANRGKGTTQKCLKNFDKLVDELSKGRLSENIKLHISIKGTLDNADIYLLNDKDKIIEYYRFLEDNFIEKIASIDNENVSIGHNVPNTAVPSPVTKKDGEIFAEFVKKCREIEKEEGHFKYYKKITPYGCGVCQNCLSYKYGYHTCGTGGTSVGFLPNNMMSTCNEGFTQIVEEYQQIANERDTTNNTIVFGKYINENKVSLCVDDKGYAEHEYKMSLYNKDNTTARLATSVSLIIALAMAGQIQPCFADEKNALKGAIFIQSRTPYCIKDNYNRTGSYTLPTVGVYKLLLNGAMQYLQNEDEELRVE